MNVSPSQPTTVQLSQQHIPTIDSSEQRWCHVRNITIVAHVDHGKTTLSDSLISAAGKLNEDRAGKACVLDVGEAAERGITIESTAITLKYERMGMMVNLIDSPGHVEFNSQVNARSSSSSSSSSSSASASSFLFISFDFSLI